MIGLLVALALLVDTHATCVRAAVVVQVLVGGSRSWHDKRIVEACWRSPEACAVEVCQ